MGKSLTIILDDQQTLSDLCGINDRNLRIIEDMLDARVFTRGNEILLESEDDAKRESFRRIVDQLKGYAAEGQSIGPDLIRAVYLAIIGEKNGNGSLLDNVQIVLPGANRVYPRTSNQAHYIRGMNTAEITVGIGPAGTGKTYLAVAHALREVLTKRMHKLILTRPVVEAGESLGFLPGDLTQKISPYLRPLYDAMDSLVPVETVAKLEENRIIEIAPLAYMRGRSLNNCYVILDEAQNTTREQMKMFLTRLGEGSRAVVTGDITQIDLPKKDQSGLTHAMRILHPIEEIHFTFFDAGDVVRNPLVKKIIHAYESDS
ncbi:MAG TPA: PhoH family protein [Spirochaetia bacterium]|nr:PhoH family protein [Spirochaetia bacterium]